MKAFDTDILTELLLGEPEYIERAAKIPLEEQAVPIIVIEEIIRGRFNVIRQAEAGKGRITIDQAYALFEATMQAFQQVAIVSYTAKADELFREWRIRKIRVPTHDLRIGAVCVAHSATLISRNRRDFTLIPDLLVEFWE